MYKKYFLNRWHKYITKVNETFTKQDGRHSRNSTESSEIDVNSEEAMQRDHMQTIDENGSTSQEENQTDTVSIKSTEEESQPSTVSQDISQKSETGRLYYQNSLMH